MVIKTRNLEENAMKTLGIDIGTTTISAVVNDPGPGVLAAMNVKNDTFLPGAPWERIQDPQKIWQKLSGCVREMLDRFPDVQAIGVTGQMHGILYLDQDGSAVSPLYTWQDGRGDLPCEDGRSWAAQLSEITGYSLSTGYGLVTHYYNVRNGLVPETAVTFCTIQDYAAMRLAGLTAPRMDPTDAASLGLYDCVSGCFDGAAMEKAGMDPGILPALAEKPCLGTGELGIPVYAAIGDNQASLLGATEGKQDVLLVNMGTGGQISVFTPAYMQTGTLETRPFPGGGWLMVGASLCGGRSYALLEDFFRQTVKMVTGEEISAYDAMARMLEGTEKPTNLPQTVTTFQGTRRDPSQRGSISSLTAENFTPLHLTWSVMEGMAQELYGMFRSFLALGGRRPACMIGSGNGLRRNPWLCRVFEDVFQCPLTLSLNDEEAACGAALYASRQI